MSGIVWLTLPRFGTIAFFVESCWRKFVLVSVTLSVCLSSCCQEPSKDQIISMVKVAESRVALKRIAWKANSQSRVKLAQRTVAQSRVALQARPGTTLKETNISHLGKNKTIFKSALGGHVSSQEGTCSPIFVDSAVTGNKAKERDAGEGMFFYASLFVISGIVLVSSWVQYRSARHIFTIH